MSPRSRRLGLSVPFAAPERQAADLVLLEQEEQGAYAGRLTVANMVRHIEHAVYGASASAPRVMDCGVDASGNLNTAILVWPYSDTVRYRLLTTIGTPGPAEPAEVVNEETVSFTLTETARLRRPGRRILDARWLTGPWTSGGERIEPPALTVDGPEVRANRTVYGSVRLKVSARRYRHRLAISWTEARPLLESGDWSEWALCLPVGGPPAALALEAHRGAADMARSGRGCGRISFHVDDDDDWPPECLPESRTVDCDYCSLRCEDVEDVEDEGEY